MSANCFIRQTPYRGFAPESHCPRPLRYSPIPRIKRPGAADTGHDFSLSTLVYLCLFLTATSFLLNKDEYIKRFCETEVQSLENEKIVTVGDDVVRISSTGSQTSCRPSGPQFADQPPQSARAAADWKPVTRRRCAGLVVGDGRMRAGQLMQSDLGNNAC